nr:MAG TPA: hypothetical protein [Caudoviricetes sp.]
MEIVYERYVGIVYESCMNRTKFATFYYSYIRSKCLILLDSLELICSSGFFNGNRNPCKSSIFNTKMYEP